VPFEFKPPRTPRQAQADMVKRRVHLPALAQEPFKVPDLLPQDFAALTPAKIGSGFVPVPMVQNRRKNR
jgi:hypothetical protein